MKYKFQIILLFLFLMSLFSINIYAKEIKIVTTTSDIASITKMITGDEAEVTNLCNGNEDPHFLQAKPSFIMKARDANLWISIGMDLEVGWEPKVIEGARNNRILPGQMGYLDLSVNITPLDVPTEKITRAMGDVHPKGNPHYWLSPYNGRVMAETICERLSQMFPDKNEIFEKNLKKFKDSLDEKMFGKSLVDSIGGDKLWNLLLRKELEKYLKEKDLLNTSGGWYSIMLPHKGKSIITYHESWNYFVKLFDLKVLAHLEPKPGIPPSPSHLEEVAKLAKSNNTKLIIVEPFYGRKTADKLAESINGKVLVLANSVGGSAEAKDYFSLIDEIVKKISENL